MYDEPYLYHTELLKVLELSLMGEEAFSLNFDRIKVIMNLPYFLELL